MFNRTLLRASIGILTVTLAVILGAGVASAALPHPVTAAASGTTTADRLLTVQTPTQHAYAAFTTWERHPTRANLDKLVTASFKLPAKYTASDITQLAADVLGNDKAVYITEDKGFVEQDLTELMLPMAS